MNVLKCQLSSIMNAPVKWSRRCDEWTDEKAVYRSVYRTTVCEMCIGWPE